MALLIGLYATEGAGRPVARLVAATPPTNAAPSASAPTTQPATAIATAANPAPAFVAPAAGTPAASTPTAGASQPLQPAPALQTQATSTSPAVAPAVVPAVQPSASSEPSVTSIPISAGGPAAAAAPAAPAQTQTPASLATPGGAGSGAVTAPAPAISVPSATPFVPPAIAPVTPITGANQTPGPVATLSLAGGGAGGGAPAGGAGAFAPGTAPASLQSHGPSAAVIVALVLGMLAIGVLILGGARVLWKPERQDEGDAGTERARRM